MALIILILGAVSAILGIITLILAPWIQPGVSAGLIPAIALILLGVGLVLAGLKLRR